MVFMFISFLGLGTRLSCQEPGISEQKLVVRLSCSTPIIHGGDGIELRAAIFNEGPNPVFIFRNLRGAANEISRLSLFLQHGPKVDRPISNSAADFAPDHSQPFANQLAKWWILLAPGHFYGQKFYMDPRDFPQLNVPGRYRIRGEYVSHGFYLPTPNNPLQSYVSELEALPYKPWEGSVQTNSMWIEVIGKK
jgi:hypothetical protein